MTIPFQTAILRIWRGQEAVVGTGFLVRGADRAVYGVTCAHVVNAALGRPLADAEDKTGRPVACDLPFARRAGIAATVLAWRPPAPAERRDPVHDIAVLRFDRPPGVEPLDLRLEPVERLAADTAFVGYGFMAVAEGLPVQGVLRGADTGGWLVAEATGEIGRFIEEGVSGGALLAGGVVVGMAVRRFEKETRQGLAVPALALAQAFPLLARPYVGLSAFRERTAHLFHGRDGVVASLDQRLAAQGRVAVLGPSGAGKSSVVMGGLVPRRRRAGWLPVTFRPGSPSTRPLLNLAAALIAAEGRPADPLQGDRAAAIANDLAAQPSALGLRLASLREAHGAAGMLIVIDQAEEFFTAASASDPALLAERAGLLAELLRLTTQADQETPPVGCVLTARIDLLAPLADRPDWTPFLESPLWLTAMAERDVVDAIEAPARLFGVTVDRALSDGLAAQMEGEPGRLPFLGLTLQGLWPGIEQGPQGWRISMPATGVPRIEVAIAARAQRFEDDCEEARRPVLDRVLSRLVGVSGEGSALRVVRRVLRRGDVALEDWDMVQRLAEARLVTVTGGVADPDAAVAELVHDKLIDGWGRLSAMVAADAEFLRFRDGLEADRQRWKDRRETTDRLLPSADLPRATRFLAERRDELSPGVRDFILASVRHWGLREVQEQARTQRRLRVGSALFAFAALLTGTAWLLALEARDQRNAALRLESGLLVTRAREALREGDAERAYLIAAQAAWWPDALPLARRPWLPEVDQVLLEAARLMISPRISMDFGGYRLPGQPAATDFSLSPDGSWGVSSASWTGAVYVHDVVGNSAAPASSLPLTSFSGLSGLAVTVFPRDSQFVLKADRSALGRAGLIGRPGGRASLPEWPFPSWCGRSDLCPPNLTVMWIDAASGISMLRDPYGRHAVLRLDPSPALIALPDLPPELRGGQITGSPDGDILLLSRNDNDRDTVQMVRIADGRAGALTPIQVSGVSNPVFAGNDHIAGVTADGGVALRALNGPWLGATSGSPWLAPMLQVTPDGEFLVLPGRGSMKVFKRSADTLTELPIEHSEGSRASFHRLQGVLEARSERLLTLYDLSRRFGIEFEQRSGGRFDPNESVILPGEPNSRIFVLQTADRAELWHLQPEPGTEPAAVLFERMPMQEDAVRGAITFNRTGSHVALPFPDGNHRTVLSIAAALAQRGDAADPIPAAEQRLTRCLAPSEASIVMADNGTGSWRNAIPVPVDGRHACPSITASAGEPRSFWDFWRPLARELLALLSRTEGPPPRPIRWAPVA